MHHDAAGCPLPLIIPIYPPWEWALAVGHRSFWWLRSGDLQLDEWYLGHLDGSSSLQQHIALGMCWWMLESKLRLEWGGKPGNLALFGSLKFVDLAEVQQIPWSQEWKNLNSWVEGARILMFSTFHSLILYPLILDAPSELGAGSLGWRGLCLKIFGAQRFRLWILNLRIQCWRSFRDLVALCASRMSLVLQVLMCCQVPRKVIKEYAGHLWSYGTGVHTEYFFISYNVFSHTVPNCSWKSWTHMMHSLRPYACTHAKELS